MKTRLSVTQTGADTFTAEQLILPQLDGKSGYLFKYIRAMWLQSTSVTPADSWLKAMLQTVATPQTFDSDDVIDAVGWGITTMAAAQATMFADLFKEHELNEPRLSVQPDIYVGIKSSATTQINSVIVEVGFEIVKLSELEFLRLLAGGA
jgi:hypothetical protein